MARAKEFFLANVQRETGKERLLKKPMTWMPKIDMPIERELSSGIYTQVPNEADSRPPFAAKP